MGLMINSRILLTMCNPAYTLRTRRDAQLGSAILYCLPCACTLLLIIRNHCIPCISCVTRCESSIAPPLGHLSSELRVEPEVDDGIHTDRGLTEHGGDGQDVEGVSGLGCVASCFYYGHTGIRKPAENVGQHLNRTRVPSEYCFTSCSPWRPP